MASAELAFIIQLGHDLVSSKYYLVAGTVVLVYDYLLTLSDEFRYGWKAKSGIFTLFIANRYISLLYSIWINLIYHLRIRLHCKPTLLISLLWTGIATAIAQIFLTLRIYALSNKNKMLLYLLLALVATQFLYSIVLASLPGNKGIPIPSTNLQAFHACIFFPANQQAVIAYLGIVLAFEGIVFFITLASSIRSIRSCRTSAVVRALVRGGIIYFFVIFSHAFIWMMFIASARDGLKFLPSQTHILIMPVMINRLIISLRKASEKGVVNEWSIHHFQPYQQHSDDQNDAIPMSNLSLERRMVI